MCNAWHQKQMAVENGNLRPTGSVRSTSDEPANIDKPLKIKVVHFSGPVTTVIWEDGTKSQVRCQDGDHFDPEKGLALAIAKRALGNKGSWYDEIKKWVEPYYTNALNTTLEKINNYFDAKRIGNFEFTQNANGGTSVKYVGPQDSDEAKKEHKTLDTTTDTTPKPTNGETSKLDVRCSTCKFLDTPVTQIPCSGCDMHYSCWEATEKPKLIPKDIPQNTYYNPVEKAYGIALKIRDGKECDIEKVIGLLYESLYM
jgi:hypothetical protein